MERPFADKRPLGPFAQRSINPSITLYTTYDVDRDFGEALEGEDFRSQLEDRLEDHIKKGSDLRNPDVTLHPAGFVVGVEVDTNARNVESYLEDALLDVLDQEMGKVGNGTRPGPDDPEYEWQVR